MEKKDAREIEIQGQHNSIKVCAWDKQKGLQNNHPDAQWYAHAGLGLFLHWGIAAVSGEFDLSWAMITGWELAHEDVSDEEIARMTREKQFRKDQKETTPNEYFRLAEGFKAERYNPREWMRLAKEAGFTYAVFTTRHHDGFALWPTEYGNFNTKNYLNGRDLVGEYVDACREFGIRVGLYYSPPDWYFNKDYMSFMIYTAKQRNPGLPELDTDYNPRSMPSPEVMDEQNRLYGAHVRGQIEELLTRYGKIDLLWFDGSMPKGYVYPMEEIRRKQPGIVVNTRMHGDGDFESWEVKEASERPKAWWEFCTQWPAKGWGYQKEVKYRPLSAITTEFARVLNWGGNYLLDIGPKPDGTFPEEALRELDAFTKWRGANAEGITGVTPLPDGESCTTPAAAKGRKRYLYLLPDENGEIQLTGIGSVLEARLLDDGTDVSYEEMGNGIRIKRPNACTDVPLAVRVIEISL